MKGVLDINNEKKITCIFC